MLLNLLSPTIKHCLKWIVCQDKNKEMISQINLPVRKKNCFIENPDNKHLEMHIVYCSTIIHSIVR